MQGHTHGCEMMSVEWRARGKWVEESRGREDWVKG